ncbi:MAG TPA: hypothetical protein VFT12_05090, partial [Thermoanaerobaculia bacterium]|nr:hypothetical protein [Thermoanaerobaculia bacterium]
MSLFAEGSSIRGVIEAATPRPVTPIYAELSEQLQVALHRALAGEVEPRTALDQAAKRMQRLIDESGLR